MIAAISRNKTGYRIWLHLLFWGLYYGFLLLYFWNINLIGSSFHLNNHGQVFSLCGIMLVVSIYLHYGAVHAIMPVYKNSIVSGIVLTILFLFSTFWLSHFLLTHLLYDHRLQPESLYYSEKLFTIKNLFFFSNVTIYITFTSITLKLALSYYTTSKKTLLLSQLRNETEVEFLKSQIKPHFLFNALNSIYGIALNDQEAINILLEFSKLLRYLLYNSDDRVALEEEIDIIRIYAHINRQINPALNITFHFDKVANCTIKKYDLFTQVQHIFTNVPTIQKEYNLIQESDKLYFK
ncbi:histidine kinase [Chitinophaga sancti]|uniref:histidine kinase n=1 Tax=Chitinophaga sancti TaxID=1004 RepID=UPI002A74D1E1|nr:histidine kinase [Chitinophaga sancti]WPQ63435.1 histidine kinase [Chitinophaga sancti]